MPSEIIRKGAFISLKNQLLSEMPPKTFICGERNPDEGLTFEALLWRSLEKKRFFRFPSVKILDLEKIYVRTDTHTQAHKSCAQL